MSESRRYASVDALRGLTVAAMLLVNNPGDWGHVYAPLEHAAWNGFTPTDLVFPLFVFIVGVSLTLALASALERGAAPATLARGVVLRAMRIVALGLVLHLVAHWAMGTPAFRPMGVLQRIGVCFAAGGALALYTRSRTQWCVFAGLIAGYAALLLAGGSLEPLHNIADQLDAFVLGRGAYVFDARTGLGQDPEGLLSTLGALATTVLGLRAGDWLRQGRAGRLACAGALALAMGAIGSLLLAINKQLWTSSYVLWSGGWSLLALALAHRLVDERGWPPIGRRFGINAISAYALAWLATCALVGSGAMGPLFQAAFGWIAQLAGPDAASLGFALAFVAASWLPMWWLDRRGLAIKI